ncbi:tautomerase family protein [Pseudonocardia acaciae]|uniref:tautomerase family protein n=1 Tax=Pseudonocardia acaciae TaxID=551276 RepID=UPI0004918FC5|nr:tautomerase family protein [Pseudonocardia acaciae]
MPTYVIHTHDGTLTAERREVLARRVTIAHSRATGAPPSFAQVIYQRLALGDHFIGGELADAPSVFVHGHIRDGRTREAKAELASGIRDGVVEVAGVPEDAVWVYLCEVPAAQMVEFGRVLPEHGREGEWMASLDEPLRERLLALGRRLE